MEWSANSATNAYLDTLKLCKKHKAEECRSCEHHKELESVEFISALAAGMSAQLMVEVTPEVSSSTVALAAAARQTGGKLVCILPQLKNVKNESQKVIDDSGLHDMVEFRTGDPIEVLPSYPNIDFSLVDCNNKDYSRLLEQLDVNPRRSVVVANNLVEGSRGLEGHVKGVDENECRVRSVKHSIGKGMEITMIGKSNSSDDLLSYYHKKEKSRSWSQLHSCLSERKGGIRVKRRGTAVDSKKSQWIVKIDEKSGEEHIFRMLPK